MPGFDRTGPEGRGPRTGRGFGPCGRGIGYGAGAGFGRRAGFGRGRGMGFGRGFRRFAAPLNPEPVYDYPQQAVLTKEEEIASLRSEKELAERDIKDMQEEIKAIEKRIKKLEK